MFLGPLQAADVYFPLMLAALTTFLAGGVLWANRRSVHPARTLGVTTIVLGALAASSWLAVERGAQRDATLAPIAPGLPEPMPRATPAAQPTLDLARTQCAEARDHFGRIMLLVRNLKNAEAGAEMLASTDHLERALRAAGPGPDASTAALLREVRVGAAGLIQASGGVPVSIGMAIEALGSEVDRATARLGAPRA